MSFGFFGDGRYSFLLSFTVADGTEFHRLEYGQTRTRK